jgi:hypothetical protein
MVAGACGARVADLEIGDLSEWLTEQTLQAAFTKNLSFVGKGCRFKACHEDLKGNHFVLTQTQQEFEIFFSASHQFRNREVMDFQTQAGESRPYQSEALGARAAAGSEIRAYLEAALQRSGQNW